MMLLLDPHRGSTRRAMPTSGLRVRVEPELRKQFIEECRRKDLTASQVIRGFMRRYIEEGLKARLWESVGKKSKHEQ